MDEKDQREELEQKEEVAKKPFFTKARIIIAAVTVIIILAAVVSILFVKGVFRAGHTDSPVGTTENIDMTKELSETETVTETEQESVTETEKESVTEKETETKKQEESKPQNTVKYKADFKVVNSWEEGGKKCYQLSGTVTNLSSSEISSWMVVFDAGNGAEIKQSWNSNCTISGNKITVGPADYNSKIGAGASVSDVGMIIATSSAISDFTYNGEAIASGQNTGNGGNGNNGGNSNNAGSNNDSNSSNNGNNSGNNTQTTEDVKPYTPPKLESGTPVDNHGQLSVKGVDLVDKNGSKYQLKGVSTHGLQWFPQYVNEDTFKTLRDWGANVVRLAMYTGENGYCSGGSKADLEAKIDEGVKAASELGMYVIIDWHILSDGNPDTNRVEAVKFFNKMSKKYSKNVNVIYEICNEPNGGVDWNTIKTYADTIISTIRKNSPNAIILVGTPTWSQDVDAVAANPVANKKNVMYTLHFYAGTHKDNIRNKLTTARNAGTPVFISEFSICDASGNGGIDYTSANAWKKLINDNNVSYVGWSLCNKAETSALIASSCSKLSDWSDSELSETGKWLRNFIAGK